MTTVSDESPATEPVEVPFLATFLLFAVVFLSVDYFDPPLWLGAVLVGLLGGGGQRLMYEFLRRRVNRARPSDQSADR